MGLVETFSSIFAGTRSEPVGTIHICDPSPLNWLHITYNTVEELVRVNPAGMTVPAAMKSYTWADERTLDVTLRKDNLFPNGEALNAAAVKKSFDEMMRWLAPHPPGTHFNNHPSTTCEWTDEYTVRFRFPETDSLALGKFRVMHLMSSAFWAGPGFGYQRKGSGEGRWSAIDRPGSWGTGPFTLSQGVSAINSEQAIICRDRFASTWIWSEERDPQVRLTANPHYWDVSRGPFLQEIVFRNDLTPAHALDLVCTSEGNIDIVTEIPPASATKVEDSRYAKLVSIDGVRAVAGVINRHAVGLPLADLRARQALNHAINRDRLVLTALSGFGAPLFGLSPPSTMGMLHRHSPYAYDPRRAAELWNAAESVERFRPIRLAAFANCGAIAKQTASDLRESLGLEVEVTIHDREEELQIRRQLAERLAPLKWDLLILMQVCQSADAPPFELHRAFVGEMGEYRAGPVVAEFESIYAELIRQTSPWAVAAVSRRIDRLVHDEALALFLCSPYTLYAINREVNFTPYRTSFELAECWVTQQHWSRR